MGGIGGKGPGETKLEVDRRRIKQRISSLERALRGLEKQRSQMRKKRSRDRVPVFSIIGYTNAGKSTLLNRLTKSSVLVRNELFATLDPSTKALFLEDRKVLLSDTVGFITNMPPDIKTAFKATLEELEDSAAFIHVLDASSPFILEEIAATEDILREMNLSETPRITVLNKMDIAGEKARKRISRIEGIPVSARTGQGIPDLVDAIREFLGSNGNIQRPEIQMPRLNFAEADALP
ncbi:MAG: GTPase HflX [Thermodesulfatator sp.]|nr:MAG: GTPase HflX [Thermodesulfatator sp.]